MTSGSSGLLPDTLTRPAGSNFFRGCSAMGTGRIETLAAGVGAILLSLGLFAGAPGAAMADDHGKPIGDGVNKLPLFDAHVHYNGRRGTSTRSRASSN